MALFESLLALSLIGGAALALLEWQHARQMAQFTDLALLEAARAGAADQARPESIHQAFRHSMRAAAPDPAYADSDRRLRASWQRAARESGMPAWHIAVLSPTAADLQDHPSAAHAGPPVLAFYYQAQTHAANLARGWPNGIGPHSGRTVFQANRLHLRLQYLHRPLSPIARTLLKRLAATGLASNDPARQGAMQAGYWLLRREIRLPMTSPAAAVLHRHPQPSSMSLPTRGVWAANGPDTADGETVPSAAPPAPPAPIPSRSAAAPDAPSDALPELCGPHTCCARPSMSTPLAHAQTKTPPFWGGAIKAGGV